MSTRFVASNAVKLLLLLPIVLGASQALQLLALFGIIASLVFDAVMYRRDSRQWDEEETSAGRHVPLPPARQRREEG